MKYSIHDIPEIKTENDEDAATAIFLLENLLRARVTQSQLRRYGLTRDTFTRAVERGLRDGWLRMTIDDGFSRVFAEPTARAIEALIYEEAGA